MSFQLTIEILNNSFSHPFYSFVFTTNLGTATTTEHLLQWLLFSFISSPWILNECRAINEEKMEMESTYFLQAKKSIIVRTYISFVDIMMPGKINKTTE